MCFVSYFFFLGGEGGCWLGPKGVSPPKKYIYIYNDN